MRTALIACALLAAGPAGVAHAAPEPRLHGPPAVARSLLAAELAFEARSEAAGAAIAMRDFMDPVDGLTFTGGEPNRGAAAIFAAHSGPDWAGRLTWVPAEIFAAAAGDMGVTWGHFRFTPPGKPAPLTGRYVTVWRRTPGGAWKGIIDIGDADPPPK